MRKKNILILIFFILMFVHLYSIDAPIDLVNPLIGTGGHGHTFPGATLPFGMVQLSPDTDTEGWDWCSGYHYSDSSIMGFSHTHLSGTGASDYGDILVMPTTGRVKLKPGSKDNPEKGYRSRFSHKKESATPGFYSVYLEDYDIDVELTVTKRAGFHKYNFPNTDRANIIFDLQHGIHDRTKEAYVKLVNDQEIEGYRRSTGWAKDHCVYFIAKFSQKFEQYGIEENEKLRTNKKSAKGRNIKTFFRFTTRKNSPVLVKVGISHTSIEGARKNLDTEIPAWNFEKIRKNAKNNWTKALNKIDVKGGIGESREVFYTAFYHTMIAPNTFMDVDSQYIRMDDKIHKAEGFTNYTVFSLWDTFRALHPLLNILKPNKSRDMIKTMLKKYEHSGLLPVWELAANETNCMIGYHSIPVITDAYIKGIKDFDIDRAYKAMKTSAMQNDFGIKPYREYGYIPANLEHESVSKTLEYAYDDWCIAQMAKKMGKQEDYQYFIKRAQYYKNLFDNQTGFMRPKKRGKWSEPFNPNAVSGDYTEANAWQYSFFAPQDVSGMLELYGGKKKFCKKLDDLFSTSKQLTGKKQPDISGLIGQYAHGNEPSHHMAYLYSYADQEWKTQAMLRRIMTNFYTNEPEGLAGNEDCGQMSAWYIFSSMGFYPVCPGSDYYVLGTPLFKEAEIHLKNGRSINITAQNLSENNKYVKELFVNGEPYRKAYIDHECLIGGCEIKFIMSDHPNKEWFITDELLKKSKIEEELTPIPYFDYEKITFKDSTRIQLACIDEKAEIYYIENGSMPTEQSQLYKNPILIDQNCEIVAKAFKSSAIPSMPARVKFKEVPFVREIKLNTDYAPRYSAGGDQALVNSIFGTKNYWTGEWQGYKGVNLDAVIDLRETRNLKNVSIRFLQDTRAWIFMPEKVELYISADSSNFQKVEEIQNKISASEKGVIIKQFKTELKDEKARYIRIEAHNRGKCPDWHRGAGNDAWIFADEISVSIKK